MPHYYNSFERTEKIAEFDYKGLLADLEEAGRRGLFVMEGSSRGIPTIPPPVGWLSAMGMAPFASPSALFGFGNDNLTTQAEKLEARISTEERADGGE